MARSISEGFVKEISAARMFVRAAAGMAGLLLLALSGCGPQVKVDPQLQSLSPRAYALLPIEVPASVRRERADLIYSALMQALQSRGFQLLDEDVVKATCSSPECPEREQLMNNYAIDALLVLNISSISRTNAIAGYYNAIDGELSVLGKDNKELLSVKHTQSERGGLLFNSGQAFQALKSTVANLETDTFPLLADRFAAAVAGKLPPPAPGMEASTADLAINEVSVKPLGESRFMICAAGTPKMWAYFIAGHTRTNLRETGPGRYCSALFLERSVPADSTPVVELHSLFGTVKQRRIDEMALVECDPSNFATLNNNELRVDPQCGPAAASDPNCARNAEVCERSKILVYTARDAAGPYQRNKGPLKLPWKETAPTQASAYAVLAVNPGGVRSIPHVLEVK